MTRFIVNNKTDALKTGIEFPALIRWRVARISNSCFCPHIDHKFSQWARVNFCSYRKKTFCIGWRTQPASGAYSFRILGSPKLPCLLNFPVSRARPDKIVWFFIGCNFKSHKQQKRYCVNKLKVKSKLYTAYIYKGTKVEISVWHGHWIIGLSFWFVSKLYV